MDNTHYSLIEEEVMLAPIKPYSHKEIVDMYEITNLIFIAWIAQHKEQLGEIVGKRYTIRQVELMFEKLGRPRIRVKKQK